MLKIVADTNVLISSLLESGSPKVILDLWVAENFSLVTSLKLINELTTTLKKPKLSNRISEADIESLLDLIHADAIIVNPTHTINDCRDPKDNKVLECAVEAGADVIVSGDLDLLVLDPFRGIDIILPSNLIKRLKAA